MAVSERGIYVLALASGLVAALGDAGVVRWIRAGDIKALLGGVALWNLSLVALVYMLKLTSVSRALVVFLTVNGLVALVFARFYFGDRLRPLQVVGAALAITGLVLIEWK